MPINRRVGLFLLLDTAILIVVIGIFLALRMACVPHAPQAASATPTPGATPTVGKVKATPTPKGNNPKATPSVTPSIPAVKRSQGTIMESKPGDEFNLKKLRSKTVKVAPYTFQNKDTYWGIAKKFNIDILTLIGGNPTLPYKAKIKMTINILSRKGALHTVEKGETLAKIADDYGLEEKTLKEENNIHWWHGLHEGDVVFVPNVKPLLMTKEWKDYFSRRGIFGDPLGRWGKINSPFTSHRVDPLTGEIRHHYGVDLKAKYGDAVYAAASGRVIFTGVNGGYGNLIVIAHGNGYTTYYGHLSKIYVKVGQKVHRGAGIIGRVGATGRVTGPHLHFEIRKNNKPIDPLLYI